MASDGNDVSTNSTMMNTKQTMQQSQQLHNLLSNIIDDEDTISNHTQTLARRVLWWPPCILSRGNDGNRNLFHLVIPVYGFSYCEEQQAYDAKRWEETGK